MCQAMICFIVLYAINDIVRICHKGMKAAALFKQSRESGTGLIRGQDTTLHVRVKESWLCC